MGLIYGLLYLLAILFAGATVLSIIMFVKESFLVNTENTGKKLYNPTEKTTICSECGQELTTQHSFCPYCGNKKDKQDEKDIRNNDDKNDNETEGNLHIKIDKIEENREVTEVPTQYELVNNMKVDSPSNIEKTESGVALNDDANSINETSEPQAEGVLINGNKNILEDIYISQSEWLKGDNEKAENMVPMQEQLKDSKYRSHNRKQKRKNS